MGELSDISLCMYNKTRSEGLCICAITFFVKLLKKQLIILNIFRSLGIPPSPYFGHSKIKRLKLGSKLISDLSDVSLKTLDMTAPPPSFLIMFKVYENKIYVSPVCTSTFESTMKVLGKNHKIARQVS